MSRLQLSDDPEHREHKDEEKKEVRKTEIQSQIPTAGPGERVVPPETISHVGNPRLRRPSEHLCSLLCHWGETYKLMWNFENDTYCDASLKR